MTWSPIFLSMQMRSMVDEIAVSLFNVASFKRSCKSEQFSLIMILFMPEVSDEHKSSRGFFKVVGECCSVSLYMSFMEVMISYQISYLPNSKI